MSKHKVRWGVLSTAAIAVNKVIPAMQRGALTEVVAIGSRDYDRAQSAAAQLGLQGCYGSYDELLADPDVDAVYNPLPNHLHVPWAIRALDAGKHVLCEKPIARSASEARSLLAAAREHPGLRVMEAFMYKHHPQWQLTRNLVREGRIGELRAIHTFFSYFNTDADNIRNRAEMGGGALLDIGCYPISLSRWLFDSEPRRVSGVVEIDEQFGTDRTTSAILEFDSGTSTFTVSTQVTPFQRVWIMGTHGRIEIDIPFNAPPNRECRLWHDHQGNRDEVVLPACDQYTVQGDDFARAVLEDGPVETSVADAVANMEVVDAIRVSPRSTS